MDDIVRQAIAKWPNVPHCFGWLGLDARGNWYMRDDARAGRRTVPAEQGLAAAGTTSSSISSIETTSTTQPGQWFFQNGPQRVYVELEITPLVWRLGPGFSVTAHTGRPARPRRCVRG